MLNIVCDVFQGKIYKRKDGNIWILGRRQDLVAVAQAIIPYLTERRRMKLQDLLSMSEQVDIVLDNMETYANDQRSSITT